MISKRIGYVITCIALTACGGPSEGDTGGTAASPSPSSAPSVAVEPRVPAPSDIPAGLSAGPEPLACVGAKPATAALPADGAPEIYYPEAMNRKLSQHAVLRERTGLKTVRTCADVSSFSTVYQQLLSEQPELFINAQVDASQLPSFKPESEDRPFAPKNAAGAEGDVGTSREAVLNGTATTQYATVLLSDAGGHGLCSGVAISKFHTLTAAHCFPGMSSGWFRGAISRYGCTGGSCFLIPTLYSEMWLYLTRHPNYTGGGDYADDIAVVTIYHIYDDGSVTFPDPSMGNALRLWLGGLTANSTVATMYGFGGSAADGSGVGVLRTGTNTISSVSPGWFWATRTGTQALCQGDSGGPAVVNSDKVAGLASTLSAAPCPAPGGWSLWTRIAPQIGWIEGVMAYPNGTGYQCNRYGSGSTAYARCW